MNDLPDAAPPQSWTDLGALVQRAARQALAMHLIEAAAQAAATGRIVGQPLDVSHQR